MGGSDQTKSTTKPWSKQIPYLLEMYGQAKNLYDTADLSYYPDSTVANQSWLTQQAQGAGAGFLSGTGSQAARGYADDVLGGKYLSPDSNPYIRQVGDAAAADITRAYKTATLPSAYAGQMGRGGSGYERNRVSQSEQNLGDSLSQMYGNLYSGNYAMERGMMGQTAQMMPQLDAADRANVGSALTLGGSEDMYAQQQLNDLIARYDYGQQEPYRRLDLYKSGIFGGTPAYSTTNSTVSHTLGAQDYLGMALGVGGLTGSMFAAPEGGMSAAAGMASMFSSRNYKNELGKIDPAEVLLAVKHLPIQMWRYKPEYVQYGGMDARPHIGPYAEEWAEILPEQSGRDIHLGDMASVSLAAIQGLLARVESLERRVHEYEMEAAQDHTDDVSPIPLHLAKE